MASLSIIDTQGAAQGTVDVSDSIFAAEINEGVVHQVVTSQQAAMRQGTHKVKNRSAVSGGGAKPFRQKGTGRARQGTSRSPQQRSGGTVFGPTPRSYRKDVPKKLRRMALCSALTSRTQDERLHVLKGMSVDGPKTKPFAAMVDAIAPEGRKTLIVTSEFDRNVLLSARNLPRVAVCTADEVNVVDVLTAVRVFVQEEALGRLQERLS